MQQAMKHLHNLAIWTDGPVLFSFGKGGSSVLANCSLCGTEVTLSSLEGPVCLYMFSAEACAIMQALCWSWTAPNSLPFVFTSLTLALSLPLCPLLHLSFYLNLCSKSSRNCILMYYQATVGARTLVSPKE